MFGHVPPSCGVLGAQWNAGQVPKTLGVLKDRNDKGVKRQGWTSSRLGILIGSASAIRVPQRQHAQYFLCLGAIIHCMRMCCHRQAQ
jgi:hypothetical protein